MKLHSHTHPRRPCAARAADAHDAMRSGRLLLATTLAAAALCMAAAGIARADLPGATEPAPGMRRVDILLDPTALPPADRAASEDRRLAIAQARGSGLPLFRSFEPRATLGETLAILRAEGVDLGPSAIVNFDSIEAWIPAAARRELAALPFIKRIRKPVAPVAAGLFDSEGIELTGADLAHTAGTTGAGITVAIIDKDYKSLTNTITDVNDELYAIPTTDMWEQASSGSASFNNVDLDTKGDREHGTATAEVVYEMAPGATIDLYRVKSTAGIEYAIDHAAAQGADIILVPLTHIETMGDPVGVGSGGTNRFTDNIDAAVAAGSVVIVAAGNEGKRHLAAQYQPCAECVAGHPSYICNDANDNDQFHKFQDAFEELPLNALTFDDDHFDAETFKLTCWSAIEPGFDPNDFEMQLYKYDEGSVNPEPICPGDSGAQAVAGTKRNLGGFFERTINIFDADFDEQFYYMTVSYKNPNNPLPVWPNFRVACGTGVDEFLFATTPGSLSDLAVVESAITVSEVDAFFEDEVTVTSSQGPAASGPLKPDVGGPGIVENFAVQDFDFIADWTFNGTSAASAHVAGIVALMQSHRAANGLPPLPLDAIKAWLAGTAIDIEDVGNDTKTGAGLVQVPDWVMVNAPAGPQLDLPAQELVVGNSATLTGIGFTPGSRILLFVPTATGPVSHGPYTPSAQSTTSLTWDIDPSIPLGNGFGTVLIVNTDENFVQSATQSQLLYGDPSLNIPTVLTVDGVALTAVDPTIPTANVETVISQGSTVTITGTGFNNPLVNLFTAAGNVGPLVPLAGGTATSFQIQIPAGTVTGPGSFQVVNNPFTGNVISNAVSVPIGQALDITSISQVGNTVTVDGAGFSALSVINFFASSGGSVVNLGGLDGSGNAKIPLTILSENQFTFQVPAAAQPGAAYVMVLNPPFIPFSSTTGDPDGGFTLS